MMTDPFFDHSLWWYVGMIVFVVLTLAIVKRLDS